MKTECFSYEERDRIALITLKTSVGNPAGCALLAAELAECCSRFRENPDMMVLVIAGEEKDAFSIGNEDLYRGMGGLQSFAVPIAELERPVLAAIAGDAMGLGLELALACDVRIASQGVRLGLPQVKFGTIPMDGGIQRLLRTVGKGKTLEMVLTGEPVGAEEALRIGLISRLVPDEALVPTIMEMAQKMAEASPVSLQYCKEAVIKGGDLTLEQGLRLEADLYFLMHTTKDRTEGMRAFQEKRKPEFTGQ